MIPFVKLQVTPAKGPEILGYHLLLVTKLLGAHFARPPACIILCSYLPNINPSLNIVCL